MIDSLSLRNIPLQIGKSLFDKEGAKLVPGIFEKAAAKGVKIYLPIDHVTGDKFGKDAQVGTADNESGIEAHLMGLDVGPQSQQLFAGVIARAKTVVWNGYASSVDAVLVSRHSSLRTVFFC